MHQWRMKAVIRKVTRSVLPRKYWTLLQSVRARNYEQRWLASIGILDLAARFSGAHGSTVLHGPFEGMIYPATSLHDRNSVPKILGSYECELHDVIDSALRKKYYLAIDVGSAEGYYAVGFAAGSSLSTRIRGSGHDAARWRA
jgi:hypothetical protein